METESTRQQPGMDMSCARLLALAMRRNRAARRLGTKRKTGAIAVEIDASSCRSKQLRATGIVGVASAPERVMSASFFGDLTAVPCCTSIEYTRGTLYPVGESEFLAVYTFLRVFIEVDLLLHQL